VEINFVRDKMKTEDKNVYFRNLRKVFSKFRHLYVECLISIIEGKTSVPFRVITHAQSTFFFATNERRPHSDRLHLPWVTFICDTFSGVNIKQYLLTLSFKQICR
jgi:hypothetical protein